MVSIQQNINLDCEWLFGFYQTYALFTICSPKNMGVVTHMNYLRLFNAIVSLMISSKEICRYTDFVLVNFSKDSGFGALIRISY